MKRVILGCGYIGTALAKLWQGPNLFLTTTTPARKKELEQYGQAVVVKGHEKDLLQKLLLDADQVVVAVAAQGGSYEEAYLTTAQTVCPLLPPNAHLLYTSSSSVYGDYQGAWVTEESELRGNPILIETEKVYLQLPHVTILRLGGIYGPGRELEKHARRLAGSVQNDSYCNWVSRDDIVRTIDWAFAHKLEGIYNVCSSYHPKRSALYNPMVREMGLEPIEWQEGPAPFGNKRVSTEKINQAGLQLCAEYGSHAAGDKRSL